jgi:glycerophosphoryl diester phosphodiesterase
MNGHCLVRWLFKQVASTCLHVGVRNNHAQLLMMTCNDDRLMDSRQIAASERLRQQGLGTCPIDGCMLQREAFSRTSFLPPNLRARARGLPRNVGAGIWPPAAPPACRGTMDGFKRESRSDDARLLPSNGMKHPQFWCWCAAFTCCMLGTTSGMFLAAMVTALQWQDTSTTQNVDHTMLLQRAHSHNDYNRPRPLLDALEAGFCSVEADVHLSVGTLKVGHDRGGDETLEELYLRPLLQLIAQNEGFVHRSAARLGVCKTFTVLVDVKTDGVDTFEAVEAAITPLSHLLHCGGHAPALSFVISGNRPSPEQYRRGRRCSTVDARWSELTRWNTTAPSGTNGPMYTLLSDAWPRSGMSDSALHSTIARAHSFGLRTRFWHTPEDPRLWHELIRAGVDVISTDVLRPLADFLTEAQTRPRTPPAACRV